MASEEIGLAELKTLVGRHAKWIVGLAVAFGLAAFVLSTLFVPHRYLASANLVTHHPVSEEMAGSTSRVEIYRSLLRSDSILQLTTEKLVAEGVLTPDRSLDLDGNVWVKVEPSLTRNRFQNPAIEDSMAIIELRATATDPEVAAAIANTWAEVFIERCRSMIRSPASGTGSVLDEQLPRTREQLEALDAEKSRVMDEYQDRVTQLLETFQKREDEISAHWDRQIASAGEKAARTLADYQIRTRELMEEVLARYLPDFEAAADLRPRLLEIVSVRAELAKAPRVLTLEKAASDETLAEILAEGRDANHFDSTLISQEINPLYDQLSVHVLQLENELKRDAGPHLAEVSKALGELEKIQLERSAGLAAVISEHGLEPRSLRRRRSFALRNLWRERGAVVSDAERERDTALAELERQHGQLQDLEQRLREGHNTAVLFRLLEQVDMVELAAPAVPPRRPQPRRVLLKVAAAMMMGGVLGLLIALFRGA